MLGLSIKSKRLFLSVFIILLTVFFGSCSAKSTPITYQTNFTASRNKTTESIRFATGQAASQKQTSVKRGATTLNTTKKSTTAFRAGETSRLYGTSSTASTASTTKQTTTSTTGTTTMNNAAADYNWLTKTYPDFAGKNSTMKPEKTIIYKQVGNIKLPINIYRPADGYKKNNITVICIEGSGWRPDNITTSTWDGSKYMKYTAQYFANRGFAAIEINYRSIQSGEFNVYDCIEDCRDAYHYILNNLDFVESDKIVLLGESAGGHLVLTLTLDPDNDVNPCTVISINPVVDLNTGSWSTTAPTAELRAKISPINLVRKADPKYILVQGTADIITPKQYAENLRNKMLTAGNSCGYMSINGENHACLLYGYQRDNTFINGQMKILDTYLNAALKEILHLS